MKRSLILSINWRINLSTNKPKINQQLTIVFSYKKGIRQGDPLSPTMFNIFVNDLFGELVNVNNSPVNLEDQENF